MVVDDSVVIRGLISRWVGSEPDMVVAASLRTHLGPDLFAGPYGPLIRATSTLLVFWLVCFWMYRQKIFIKI